MSNISFMNFAVLKSPHFFVLVGLMISQSPGGKTYPGLPRVAPAGKETLDILQHFEGLSVAGADVL
ncbi:MAG: hypothetical protein PHO01_11790 [Desulfotomaculaceae bacterium]|nr:hypothetical protein [Desulfotomaculaceae bacterium]